jgi:hypothetical protein
MWEGSTLRVMVADRPCGEFYDFYSISPEYFVYHHASLGLSWFYEGTCPTFIPCLLERTCELCVYVWARLCDMHVIAGI